MKFDNGREYVEYLLALSPQDLCRLYKLVANVDHDVRNPTAEIERGFNVQRAMLELDWAAEIENEPAENERSPSP
jgi:hypothetical protein